MDSLTIFRNRYRRLFSSLNARPVRSLRACRTLEDLYTDPSRGYHGIAHIEDCLNEFDACRHLAKHPDAIEAAILYHDAIMSFEPGVTDNEERSASLMRDHLTSFEIHAGFVSHVSFLIMPGTKHTGDLVDHDAKLISDIDLAGFGHPWSKVVASSRKIRHEYRTVPYDDYVKGRRAVLSMFLERRMDLYYHREFQRVYGSQALANIERELDQLTFLVKKFDDERVSM